MSSEYEDFDPDYIDPQERTDTYLKGRGAQYNTKNRFLKDEIVREHVPHQKP